MEVPRVIKDIMGNKQEQEVIEETENLGETFSIFTEAEALVNGDRQEKYGPPSENLARIAALWSDYLGSNLKPLDVCMMLVLVKVARVRGMPEGEPVHRDNLVDIAGYARLVELLETEQRGI